MALIPPFYFNCVVALGKRASYGKISWVGTGTLVGRLFASEGDGRSRHHIFLVTSRHVLEGNDSMVVRFNPLTSHQAKDYDIPLYNQSGTRLWKGHPDISLDVAALGMDADFLERQEVSYSYFQSNSHLMPVEEMERRGVSEGDFIYVLGFPMGIVAPDRQYVIARSGIIARLRDTLEKQSKDFLVDAMVFPGNSGGPVIYKPEIISIEGTQSVATPALIGIVSGYLTFKETALSEQTGQARIVFEENSGLSTVIPTDYIMETIEACFSTMNIREAETLRR
ncbi:MAG: trypsin-like peptidase domain-containing protein [bacterium]